MSDLSFWFFLCSGYRYIIYTHSRSKLCHSNVSSMYYVGNKYLNNDLDILRQEYLMSGKNRLFKSGKTIRLQWDFCRRRISAGFGKSAGFRPELEPKSGRALASHLLISNTSRAVNWLAPIQQLQNSEGEIDKRNSSQLSTNTNTPDTSVDLTTELSTRHMLRCALVAASQLTDTHNSLARCALIRDDVRRINCSRFNLQT